MAASQTSDRPQPFPLDLPDHLLSYLESRYGEPFDCAPLTSGQSGASVYRMDFSGGSVIVKATRERREPWFYKQWAPRLRSGGVPVPLLHWHTEVGPTDWLVLQYIPEPLPRERWLGDRALLSILYQLHTLLRGQIEADDACFFQPMWRSDMNYEAVSLLPSENRAEALSRLEAIKGGATALFQPICLISGDPNPTNWGLLPEGTPVLFDWARFGLGTPALDLAITVPGLGDMTSYVVVAGAYLACRPVDEDLASSRVTVTELAKAIACAKVWSVAEYLSEFVRPVGVQPAVGTLRTVNSIAVRLPEWLASLG